MLRGAVGLVPFTVDGVEAGLVHQSVLDRITELADRLGCHNARRLGELPATFEPKALKGLRRDLDQIIAFADAARRTGWTLNGLVAAPGDQPVPVLETPRGWVWVDQIRGFELRGPEGAQRIRELPGAPGCVAERVPLPSLIAPLAAAAARARLFEVAGVDSVAGSP